MDNSKHICSERRLVPFFCFIFLFNLTASLAHPVTPSLFKELGLQNYMFGVAIGVQLITNFLFSPLWGKLTGRLSSRTILLIGCSGYGMGQVLFALAKSTVAVIVARAFAGIFVGAIFTAFLSYIINTTDDAVKRGKRLALSATLQSVSSAFGFFAGGMLGEVFTYLPLYVQIGMLFLLAMGFYCVCIDDRDEVVFPKLKARDVNPFGSLAEGMKVVTPVFAMILAMSALHNLAAVAFEQSFNYYLRDVFNLTSSWNGIIKSAMGIITIVVNLTVSMTIIKKGRESKSVPWLFVLCAASMLCVVLLTELWPFLIANVVYYGMYAVGLPVLQSLAATEAKGENSNLLMGVFNGMKSFGGILGAIGSGFLYMASPRLPFIAGFAAFCLAVVCTLVYRGMVKENR